MTDETQGLRLWDDNPSTADMLGFESVVDTVIAAVTSSALDPVTVALQSSWGGGKSTALGLVEMKLAGASGIVVVKCDPWEYDDLPKAEIRSLLIGQVLRKLESDRPGFADRAKGILKRIAWAKVGTTITNMVLSREVDVEKLADAFTPTAQEPKSMAGFRDEFAKAIDETSDLRKVVVLIDDLDRCSPDSVVAILEAVKVFLAVPGLAFVLAAEEALIRFAIERSENAGSRKSYADRYLEKIVQIPVRLPTLSRDDAETYIALLLAQHRDPGNGKKLVEHVAERRELRAKPYLGGPYPAGVAEPTRDDLSLASQVGSGLSHDKWSSPRAIKRFLNAWGLRVAVAEARGAQLDLDVMLKLYILEDRFPRSFEALVSLAPEERGALIHHWEGWARASGDELVEKPEDIEDETKDWAATDPSLKSVAGKIDAYLTVAATFTSASAGRGLPSDVLAMMDDLVDASDPIRRRALEKVRELDLSTRDAVMGRLIERAGTGVSAQAIESATEIAKSDPSLHESFHGALRTHALPYVLPVSMPDIASVGDPTQTLEAIEARDGVEADVKAVAESELADYQKRQRA